MTETARVDLNCNLTLHPLRSIVSSSAVDGLDDKNYIAACEVTTSLSCCVFACCNFLYTTIRLCTFSLGAVSIVGVLLVFCYFFLVIKHNKISVYWGTDKPNICPSKAMGLVAMLSYNGRWN